jgi:uncharacterized protein YndB with AHSA1/START domain
MAGIFALTVAVSVAALLAYAATKPDTFRVERATHVDAPPDAVFALVEDFRSWAAWSPFEKLDPAMKKAYEGAPRGEGAVYDWEGNAKAGAGRMSIVEASAPVKVVVRLEFRKPFESQSTAEFTMDADGGGTKVTWAMHGPSPFVSKVMGVFVDMDRVIGKDFEAGLASLKSIAEGRA